MGTDFIELKVEVVETKNDLLDTPTKHIFKAVEKNEKIYVFFDENIGEEYECDRLFCDNLKNKEELELFFNSIEIESYIVTNDMCGGNYQYGTNPKGQNITVQFNVHEHINGTDVEIMFSDGLWFSTTEQELIGDIVGRTRTEYITAYQDKLCR